MHHCIDRATESHFNVVTISSSLLKRNCMSMELVNRKEKSVTLAPNIESFAGEELPDYLLRISRFYRRRWRVETSYRYIENFHGETHSLHYHDRYLLFALDVLLYNMWASKLRPI